MDKLEQIGALIMHALAWTTTGEHNGTELKHFWAIVHAAAYAKDTGRLIEPHIGAALIDATDGAGVKDDEKFSDLVRLSRQIPNSGMDTTYLWTVVTRVLQRKAALRGAVQRAMPTESERQFVSSRPPKVISVPRKSRKLLLRGPMRDN